MPDPANSIGTGRPRVALVAHGIHDGGGMERAFAELVRRIHHRYELVVISGDLGDELRGLVEWRRVPLPKRPAPLRFAVFYLLAGARLAMTRADIVHTLGAIVPNTAHLVSVHFCNAGYVEAVGHLAPPNAPLLRQVNTALARALSLLAERWTFRPGRVRWLAAVSRGVARELARNYPAIPALLTPNGVDTERFRPDADARLDVRRRLGFADEDVVTLFVGGDWDGKGLGLAIRAVAAASGRSSATIRLIVVGRGDERRFGDLAREVGAGEQVMFLGAREDTERYYAAADVFLLPTWYETFSLAAFEAAASGLPIVAPRVNGIEELIADGAAGSIVERNPTALADALAALAANPETRRRLGAAARERSAAYTWERSAEAVQSVYRSLTDGWWLREAVPA